MEETKALIVPDEAYLAHYGVKGMRWGVRKKPEITVTSTTFAVNRNLPDRKPEVVMLRGRERERAAAHLSRERREAQLARSDSFSSNVRKALGEREAIRLERAKEQYKDSVYDMHTRNDQLQLIGARTSSASGMGIYPTGVVETPDGPAMMVMWDAINNPGMTEKELIEKMQQRRAAIMQAEAAYAKTPAGKVDAVIKKGKALARRALNKLSSLFG